jgi:hypothetical protein
MMATASGSVFAQNRHPVCEAKQHDCDQPARVSNCCCDDVGTPGGTGTPAQSRVDVVSGTTTAPVPPQCVPPALSAHEHITVHTSPPGSALLDRTTLFACLLI